MDEACRGGMQVDMDHQDIYHNVVVVHEYLYGGFSCVPLFCQWWCRLAHCRPCLGRHRCTKGICILAQGDQYTQIIWRFRFPEFIVADGPLQSVQEAMRCSSALPCLRLLWEAGKVV